MDTFRVPRRQVEATVLLEGGLELDGKLFTPELGPNGEPGRLQDRLNDPTKDFLPLSTARGPLLLNTGWIVSVRLAAGEEPEESGEPGGHEAMAVHLRLAGGSTVMGKLPFSMPPERSRLLDFLNAGPRFVKLIDEGGTILVQRRFIVTARESV